MAGTRMYRTDRARGAPWATRQDGHTKRRGTIATSDIFALRIKRALARIS